MSAAQTAVAQTELRAVTMDTGPANRWWILGVVGLAQLI